MKDYEQLYYDVIYENRQLKNKIKELENEIQELNTCRTKKNIDLQKYIILQMKRRKLKTMISDENEKRINKFLEDIENKVIVNEKDKQLKELEQENEVLKKIIDLMALDIYKFSKGYCNTSIREKEYINNESVKLEYIRLAKEKM